MYYIKSLIAFSALALGLAACGGGNNTPTYFQPPTVTGGTAAKYYQIERLSRPAIKEVFEPFVQHQITNALEPYDTANDPLYADIPATEDFVRYGNAAGPASGPDYGKILQPVLYPDEYLVDLSQTTGGFLGADLPSKNFGGRAPDDDVIATELSVLFGNGLSMAGLGVADDMKENNCLSTENLSGVDPAQKQTTTFPYLPVAR